MLCPICEHSDAEPVSVKGGFTLVRCRACRTVFVHPMPSAETLQAHYQNPAYFEGDESLGYRSYADLERALAPHFRRRMANVTRQVDTPGRLLDFGCAAGYFLEIARAYGWQVAGVELAQDMAQEASRRLDLPIVSSLDQLTTDCFDAITLWDVIEHLPAPVTQLERLYARLHPGGLLMLSTPNAGHWQAIREVDTWIHYRPPSHLALFTSDSLMHALRRAGFEHIAISRTMPLPPLPAWLRRASAPLQHDLATGQAHSWLAALLLWRAIRIFGWGWQKLAYPRDDIFVTLEAVAFRPREISSDVDRAHHI